jgi:hypothetical protein
MDESLRLGIEYRAITRPTLLYLLKIKEANLDELPVF